MKLEKVIIIKGAVETLTGLHIGASKDTIEIGGVDSPIVRHPINRFPYIPGSSLKGKIRSLLEWDSGKISTSEPCSCAKPDCEICKIFGVGGNKTNGKILPTRAIFRDAFVEGVDGCPSQNAAEKCPFPLRPDENRKGVEDCEYNPLCSYGILMKLRQERGLKYCELKTEVAIDRLKGTAAKSGPRIQERVPAGIKFVFEVSFRVFEGDNGLLETLKRGFSLLEQDALGGSGSRGYGKVKLLLTNATFCDKRG